MEKIEPYANPYLCGHHEAEDMFLKAWKADSLHNSLMITGPEGIGKATLAYRMARFLLAADESKKEAYLSLELPESNADFRLVANRSHPNLKIIERDFIDTDKKKIIKAIKDGEALSDDELQNLKKSAVIKVDEIRTINEFLGKKSFDGNWRIVVIDSVDDMNTASANAILKILEEPPAKSLLLLISHNPNRLLPTIRSRCAKINLQPLSEDEVASLLRRYNPELDETEVKGLAKISSGSIGKALRYSEYGGLQKYKMLESLFYARKQYNLTDALQFCDEVARDEDAWSLAVELIKHFIAENMKGGEKVEELSNAWNKVTTMVNEVASLNMDKKQVMYNIITTICGAM
jgi:DNA polymerase III subunit delta'